MGKGKYEQILEEFLTVVAAEIYLETGIECKTNKTKKDNDIEYSIIKNNEEKILSININYENISIEQRSKLFLFKLAAKYAKLISKDLVIKSKPIIDKEKSIKPRPIMVKENFSNVEPILPRNLGIPPVIVGKMIREINVALSRATSKLNIKIGDIIKLDNNDNKFDYQIVKENFEKTGYWEVKGDYSNGFYIISFKVLKI